MGLGDRIGVCRWNVARAPWGVCVYFGRDIVICLQDVQSWPASKFESIPGRGWWHWENHYVAFIWRSEFNHLMDGYGAAVSLRVGALSTAKVTVVGMYV